MTLPLTTVNGDIIAGWYKWVIDKEKDGDTHAIKLKWDKTSYDTEYLSGGYFFLKSGSVADNRGFHLLDNIY